MIRFVADVHLGNHRLHGGRVRLGMNERCYEVLSVFARACALDGELVVLGDLLDNTRPAPQLLSEVQQLLFARDAPTYMLVGNHELVSEEPGDHALGPLEVCIGGNGELVVDEPFISRLRDATLLMVPYLTGSVKKRLPEIVAQLAACAGDKMPRALCAHFGVIDGYTPAYLRSNPDGIGVEPLASLCAQHGIGFVFVGHWHEAKDWRVHGVRIHQVGTLAPTGWSDPGFKRHGRVVSWDPTSGDVREDFLWGPRFANVTTMFELEQLADRYRDDLVRVRWTVPPESLEQCREYADAVMADAPNIRAVEVLPETQQDAAKHAQAAASESTEDEIAAYVAGMSLPGNVSAETVVERSKGFLR